MTVRTNFEQIDFPEDTLSPSEKHRTANGWDLTWRYKNLVSGFQIGVTMPEKLQPGPLAGQISLFAPVSLFFFFFLMLIITALRGIDLHPMNYFFLAGAFFSFHLLLAYLVDHISIHAAFLISSALFSAAHHVVGGEPWRIGIEDPRVAAEVVAAVSAGIARIQDHIHPARQGRVYAPQDTNQR